MDSQHSESETLLTKMKIYLAGPEVFEPYPIAKGISLKAICMKHGAEGLFPMDNELGDEEQGSTSQAAYIRAANMALIESCDAIIANMRPFRGPSMDVGTAYEMGVGAALGKIVVGYTVNWKSYVDKVKEVHTVERGTDGYLRDESGMAVEEFGDGDGRLVDNLMISCGIEQLCGSAEEAIKTAVETFKEKEGTGLPK
jgi:nucleoside 2-deoxyribosyltransferase